MQLSFGREVLAANNRSNLKVISSSAPGMQQWRGSLPVHTAAGAAGHAPLQKSSASPFAVATGVVFHACQGRVS